MHKCKQLNISSCTLESIAGVTIFIVCTILSIISGMVRGLSANTWSLINPHKGNPMGLSLKIVMAKQLDHLDWSTCWETFLDAGTVDIRTQVNIGCYRMFPLLFYRSCWLEFLANCNDRILVVTWQSPNWCRNIVEYQLLCSLTQTKQLYFFYFLN